jgi:phage repressor protein C with HTH and peptisase S24 domain
VKNSTAEPVKTPAAVAVQTNPVLRANFLRLKGAKSYEVLREEMAQKGISIGSGTLNRLANGDMGVRMKSIEKVAEFFRVSADQLLQMNLGETDSEEFVSVPKKQVALSAGRGREHEPHLEEIVGGLKFRSDFLRSVGASPSSAVVVDVSGHSMEPTIPDGAVVLVSTALKEPRDRLIYALRVVDQLYVKRMVKSEGHWVARSDNEDRAEYPDIDLVSHPDVEIIGRAVWVGARL